MIHPRTAIRTYAWDMLKAEVTDVNGKVFLNRPNPMLLDELPCINVYFNSEANEVTEGDLYVPHLYDRSLNITIDILREQPIDPDSQRRVEDELDHTAREVERAFAIDNFFQMRLPGYTDRNDPGLLAGSRLLNTTPDTINLDNDRVIACQSLVFDLTYLDEAFIMKKSDVIDSYMAKFNRVGWDDETIDPTLIEAEGSFS